MDHTRQAFQETSTESEARKAGNFHDVENALSIKRWESVGLAAKATSLLLGSNNPFARKANPEENRIWLLDNVAYRPNHPYPHDPQPWQAEFVACFFQKGRKDIGKFVGSIADQIGLDGTVGDNQDARHRIEERIQPFIDAIAPARTIDISIPCTGGSPHPATLGPSNANGISSQTVLTGGGDKADGTVIETTSTDDLFPSLSCHTRFAGPDGWAIISDIDDTIKITQTPDAIGILRTTFADIPATTEGMPELYKVLDEQFKNPAWFYLSASPYNLYPFLHTFLHEHYFPGTIILRDNSWMFLGGLLQSMTQGTQAYKTDRIQKIHSWLPKRSFICIGDSTQTDPESYAEMYNKHKGWIKAIYIRKVTDAPHMEAKNKDERFSKAFDGIPSHVWKVFERPDEQLADHIRHVAGEAHGGVVGALQGYFCKLEQGRKKVEAETTPDPKQDVDVAPVE